MCVLVGLVCLICLVGFGWLFGFGWVCWLVCCLSVGLLFVGWFVGFSVWFVCVDMCCSFRVCSV